MSKSPLARLLTLLLLAFALGDVAGAQARRFGRKNGERVAERVAFPADDGVMVHARLFALAKREDAPLVVFFHDGSSSSEEWRLVAPKIARSGFDSLLVDQRAGNLGAGPKSRTAQLALNQTTERSPVDAELDVIAALSWARFQDPDRPVIAVGCSYSGALALRVAALRPELVDGVAAFSPAEIFEPHGVSATWVQDELGKVRCPVWITSARNEEADWRPLFDAIPEGLATSFLPEGKGVHGAPAVNPKWPISEKVYPSFLEFLVRFLPEGPAPEEEAAEPEDAEEEPSDLLLRPVVIGASTSAGMGLDEIGLAEVLARAIRGETAPIPADASLFLFADPLTHGERMVAFAAEQAPTLVVAVDFPFWFGYGAMGPEGALLTPEDRVALLERGLALLGRLDAPLVLGDFPDMRDAVGKMLFPPQMPSPEGLAALNARLREWAEERGGVVLVPLSEMVAKMKSGEAFRIGRTEWPAGSTDRLLQADQLHPTLEGLCGVVHAVVVALVDAGWVGEGDVVLEMGEVMGAFDEVFVGGD